MQCKQNKLTSKFSFKTNSSKVCSKKRIWKPTEVNDVYIKKR